MAVEFERHSDSRKSIIGVKRGKGEFNISWWSERWMFPSDVGGAPFNF